jgi:succinyl-CoA synthetase beta subunit
MNIHEYQAKALLSDFGVKTSKGVVIFAKDDINSAIDEFNAKLYVVKAQIHAGGRGKVGGVKLAKTKQEAKDIAHEMWGKVLVTNQTGPEGQVVGRIYVEDGCDIKHEYYLSLVMDRASSLLSFVVSKEGGMDIEEVAHDSPEKIVTIHVDPTIGLQPFHCRNIHFALGLPVEQLKETTAFVTGIYNLFMSKDAEQIEINPLVLTSEGDLRALDAKISFDDNSLFRHKDIAALRDASQEEPLETKATSYGLSYVKMNGDIGCMVNGAGLAMATMDIIKLYGSEPANFLDVGGGADKERVSQAFKIILSDHHVKGILVNIFGGIMRCDIIAEGIIAAAKEVSLSVPLVVRLAGTNFELGREILANSGLKITPATDLADAAQKIVEIVKN